LSGEWPLPSSWMALPSSWMALSSCALIGCNMGVCYFRPLSLRGLILFMSTELLQSTHLPRAPWPWWLGFNTWTWEGYKHSNHRTI
jgi:hypothetical protein